MTCPICGNESCTHGGTGIRLSAAHVELPEVRQASVEATPQNSSHDPHWRKEVASRVQQHRARRGKPGNSEGAMEFDFSAEDAISVTQEPVTRERFRRGSFEGYTLPTDRQPGAAEPQQEFAPTEYPKVIRFPRSISIAPGNLAEHLAVEAEELPPRIVYATDLEVTAQYVTDQPAIDEEEVVQSGRIEPQPLATQMDLLPSFEDIRLEPSHTVSKTESEMIPQPAALQKRCFAGAVDLAAVAVAAVIFNFTFTSLAEDNPRTRMAMLCALCVAGILWILFQYLFLVYGKGTPGMRLAELELATFEGKALDARARRRRAAACTLSAISLGFGYAWTLVDEDQLSWHDRITRTLVRGSSQPSDSISSWD